MSWDLFVHDIPDNVQCMDDLPDDFEPRIIGRRAHVIEQFKRVVPSVDFSDPSWGVIDGPDYSIEVNMGDDDEINGFMLCVRAGGDGVIAVITHILNEFGLRAVDPGSETGIFDPATSKQSLDDWRTYRDQVTADSESEDE